MQALEGQALPPLPEGESLPLKEVELHQVGPLSLASCLSVCLSVPPSVRPSVCPSVCLSVCLLLCYWSRVIWSDFAVFMARKYELEQYTLCVAHQTSYEVGRVSTQVLPGRHSLRPGTLNATFAVQSKSRCSQEPQLVWLVSHLLWCSFQVVSR